MTESNRFKDVNVLYLFVASSIGLIVMQVLLFQNEGKDFDPFIWVHVFLGFLFIWYYFSKNPKTVDFKKVIIGAIICRSSVIALQIALNLISGFYNDANEVNYYFDFARMLFENFPIYEQFRAGVPPGYQAWLFIQYVINFQLLDGFWRFIIVSIFNALVDIAVLVVMRKIISIKRIEGLESQIHEFQGSHLITGLLLYAISPIPVYYYTVRVFIEPFPIFLGLIGLYYYYRKKNLLAAIFLVISALTKIVSGVWILLIVIHLLKNKRPREFLSFSVSAIITGAVLFLVTAMIHGTDFFENIFQFLEVNYAWSYWGAGRIQLNQCFWFLLYKPVYYLVVLIGIVCAMFFLLPRHGSFVSHHWFIFFTAIFIFFQPWFDQRYFGWILPFMFLDTSRSKKAIKLISWLLFISMLIYFLCMHFVLELNVNTFLDDDPQNIGLIYRLSGQALSYIALVFLMIHAYFSANQKSIPCIHFLNDTPEKRA